MAVKSPIEQIQKFAIGKGTAPSFLINQIGKHLGVNTTPSNIGVVPEASLSAIAGELSKRGDFQNTLKQGQQNIDRGTIRDDARWDLIAEITGATEQSLTEGKFSAANRKTAFAPTPVEGALASPESDFAVSTSGAPVPLDVFKRAISPDLQVNPEIAAGLASKVEPTKTIEDATTATKDVVPTSVIPTKTATPSIGSFVDQATNSASSIATQFSDQIKTKEAERAKLETDLGDELKTPRKSAIDILEDQGVKAKMDALASINAQINTEKASLNMGQLEEGQRIAPLTIIGRRQSLLEQRAAARIGALSAQASLVAGQLEGAKFMADIAISEMNKAKDDKIDAYTTLLNLNERGLVRLENKEKDAINLQMAELKAQAKVISDNKDAIFDLMQNNPEASTKAGVTFLDTAEEALLKMQPFLAAQEAKERDLRIQGIEADLVRKKQLAAKGTGTGTVTPTDGEYTETEIENILSLSADEDGNLDLTKFGKLVSQKDRLTVLNKAREFGFFDEEVEKPGFWSSFLGGVKNFFTK